LGGVVEESMKAIVSRVKESKGGGEVFLGSKDVYGRRTRTP